MKVGLVHDYLLVMRGAERSFAAIADFWPEAPIHTALFDPEGTEGRFDSTRVRTSPLQRLRARQHGFRSLLPLYPWAIGRLDMSGLELVISSSSAFAHGVKTDPETTHVCYCHSPFRYAWQARGTALGEVPAPLRRPVSLGLDAICRWDLKAASRVTHYIANSEITRQRIVALYRRDAPVVHPPVDIERFRVGPTAERGDHLIVVGELVAHKRIEAAIEAAAIVGRPIVVVGDGPEAARLRALHPAVARFVGRIDDQRLAELYSGAYAMLVPGVEEFGIAVVEAQAAGCPIVAQSGGGVRETVRDAVSGVLVPTGSANDLAAGIEQLDRLAIDPADCRRQAERFSTPRFHRELESTLRELGAL